MSAKANALKAQGVNVIAFAAGEPDFNTPEPVCQAAIDAIHAGKTKYAPSRGVPQFRDAIVAKTQRENGFTCNPSQIVVSCGAKHSLYNAFQVLLDEGDEVILIAPYWATYNDQVTLAGGVPKVVLTTAAQGFIPEIDQIKEAITPKTKAIVINSPSNPTGAAYDAHLTKKIADLALESNLWIIADEIYEHLVYNHTHTSIASLGKDYFDSTVTVMGCSKSYSMTGWRVGFTIAPEAVTTAMANLQDQVTSNATTFAQFGAIAALNLDPTVVEGMRQKFEARRALGLRLLNQVPGLKGAPPQGAFYFFVNVEECLGGRISSDLDLADYLLDEAHVATVPGSAFDAPGHLRLSYACSEADIEEGIHRIQNALTQLPT